MEKILKKKQLTGDERRYTQINQKLEATIGLTKKVKLIASQMVGFIGVHCLEAPTFGRFYLRLTAVYDNTWPSGSANAGPDNNSAVQPIETTSLLLILAPSFFQC